MSAGDGRGEKSDLQVASRLLAKLTRYFKRTIDVTHALALSAPTMLMEITTHKDPMLNMNSNAAFFRPPSCSFNKSGIGMMKMAISSMILKTPPA